MQPYPRRVLFDLSYTLSSEKMSGVERVVTNLHKYVADLCKERQIEFVPVISVQSHFYPVCRETESAFKLFTKWKKEPMKCMPFAFQLFANLLCRIVPHRKVIRALKPERGHLGIFRLFAEIWERLLRRRTAKKSNQITISKADLILMPDAYWTEMQALQAALNAKKTGASVIALAYDLIPLTHPEFVGQSRSEDFRHYFRQLLKSVSGVLAISKAVADDIEKGIGLYLTPRYPLEQSDYCRNISHFTLGCNITVDGEKSPRANTYHPTLISAFKQNDTEAPVFLMVATFDPRKNHVFLLDAFEKAWEKGSRSKLCLVGRAGWGCDLILKRINNHAEINRKLFVVHDANDSDVEFAYQNTSVSVLPSVTEGFGLPIVESLVWRKPTWASDISIHREVGGNLCKYFNLSHVDNLADMILEFENGPSSERLQSPPCYNSASLTTWEESASEFLEKAIAMSSSKTSIADFPLKKVG